MKDTGRRNARSPAVPPEGLHFAETAPGVRSTTTTSAAVIAAAAEAVDPSLAAAIREERDWRSRYPRHLVELAAASAHSAEAAARAARHGLDALHDSFEFLRDGESSDPRTALRLHGEPRLRTGALHGEGERRERLEIPWRGERLAGDALLRQIDAWASAGVMEPGAAEALRQVCRNAAWLDLRDLNVVLLGAGAEMGPIAMLSAHGANLLAVDLDRPAIWQRIFAQARAGAGSLRFPLRSSPGDDADQAPIAERAGCDLLTWMPEVRTWLAGFAEPLVVGAYAYLHGRDHVRVAVAMDAIMEDLGNRRDDVALAFLLTPTDVYAIPADAAAEAQRRFGEAGASAAWRAPLRAFTGGRLYDANATRELRDGRGRTFAIYDGIVTAQGSNYALAKRLQSWRALAAGGSGHVVSANVAPPTATASVLARRAFAAAYAGAGAFGVEVFAPETSNAIMAALLVHDLRTAGTPRAGAGGESADVAAGAHPVDLFGSCAVHGGTWRCAYRIGSVLEMAALRGFLTGAGTRKPTQQEGASA